MAQVRKKVVIYTDGACSGNPGPGGWGAVLLHGENRLELSGGEKLTTNNRMELIVQLYSDSAYLINAFRNHWIDNWQRNGWKTASKKPVENQDLWQELLTLCGIHHIEWIKVKGHADNEENNRCDALARAAIRKFRG